MRRARPPSLESLFVATFALLGLRLGLRPLGDNSLFVHLRTGIDIVRTGSIPRTDPYSFTARGEPWVVQSWLASSTYGVAERIGGFPLVRVEHGLAYAVLAWLIAELARTGRAWRTAVAAFVAVGLGVVYWSPRPLAFGLIAMAATVLVVERRRSWWLLVPIVWVWMNSHGSFVLGLAWLVAVAVGERLGGQRRPEVLPWLGAFVVGLVAGCLNPIGPRLLTFPLAVLDRREAFAKVAEWRPPDFTAAPNGVFTLLCLVGLVVIVATARPAWRDALPLAIFVGLGLIAQRNLPIAAVVAAPVLSRALTRPEAVDPDIRPRVHLAIAGALGALAAVFLAVAARQPAFDLTPFPVAAARLYDRPARVATTDIGAGYLILREGTDANVFFDDRVDMYPLEVTRDYLRLLDGKSDALRVLDHRKVEVVVWEQKRPLNAQLAASGEWRRAGERDGWVVWRSLRRGG